jgi:hypothetical protein
VTIEPLEARLAGAQWRVDGGVWHDSLAEESGLVIGAHLVSFREIAGWPTAADQTVTINLNEVATIAATYPAPTGSLHVVIEPEAARWAAGQWRVDGGAWHASDETVPGLAAGQHTVSYKDISGWTKPSDAPVLVEFNEIVSVTGTYTAVTGTMRVNIEPQDARSAGAKWCVDGGAWFDSGQSVSKLAIGEHMVSFNDVAGWLRPADTPVSIPGSQTQTITGTYTSRTGSLQVVIAPERARQAGACWRVDGGDWRQSGQVVTGLTLGSHTVEFPDVSGWDAPDSQQVTITSGQIAVLNAAYTETGGIICAGTASNRAGPLAENLSHTSGDLLLLAGVAFLLAFTTRRAPQGRS